jgi:hypothetical protein
MGRAERVERTIRTILKMVSDFTPDELRDLRFDIEERIESLELDSNQALSLQAAREQKTIREEYKKCGNPGCQCNTEGKLHGPYLYEYYRESGRLRSRYLGKAESKRKKKKT